MTKPLILINNLQIYDTIISARIAEGELIAIIGPNKSEKPLLLRFSAVNYAILTGLQLILSTTVKYRIQPIRQTITFFIIPISIISSDIIPSM